MIEYMIVLSRDCNRIKKCSFCYQKNDFNKKVVNEEAVLNFLSNINENKYSVSIVGGEPLIHKELVLKILNHKNVINLNDILLYTNLDLLDNSIIDIINKNKVKVKTNLDFLIGDKLFFKNIKFNLLNKIIKKETHFIIDRYNLDKLLSFSNLIKKFKDKLFLLNFKFHLLNPTKDDLNDEEYIKIINFYNEIQEPDLFDSFIQAICNFDNKYFLQKGSFKNVGNCFSDCLHNKKVLLPNGMITNCDYIQSNDHNIFSIVEDNKKECSKCLFNSFCIPCQLNYNEIIKESKCRRVLTIIKAYYRMMYIKKMEKPKSYSLTINIGSKCNLNCKFCYNKNDNINQLNLIKLNLFLKDNYHLIKEVDSIAGGEPLLYLNEEYNFLFDYFEYLNVTTNLTIKNNWVLSNKNIILNPSIHNYIDIKKMLFKIYKKNIGKVHIMLSISNLKNMKKILSVLNKLNLAYQFDFLFDYNDEEKKILEENFNLILEYIKNSELTLNKFKNRNKDCFKNRIHFFEDKVSICNLIMHFESKELSSTDLKIETIDKIINNFNINGELKSDCPAIDKYCKWTSDFIQKIIIKLEVK